MGYTPYQPVPIVLAGNGSTCLDLDGSAGGRRKRVSKRLGPLVSRSGQLDKVSKPLKRRDGRTDYRAAAGKIFVQLQRINKLRIVSDPVTQQADVQVLGIGRERADRLAAQKVDIGH